MKINLLVLLFLFVFAKVQGQVPLNNDALFFLPSSVWYKGGFAIDGFGNTYTSMYQGGTISFPSGSSVGTGNTHLFKHNNVGQLEWAHTIGSNGYIPDIVVGPTNNIYLTGYNGNGIFPSSFDPNGDFNSTDFIAKMNPDGSFAWVVKTPGVAKIVALPNGNVAFAVRYKPTTLQYGYLGNTYLTNNLPSLIYGEIDQIGNVLWYERTVANLDYTSVINGLYYNNGKLYINGIFNGTFDFGNGNTLSLYNYCSPTALTYQPKNYFLATVDLNSHLVTNVNSTDKLKILDIDFDSQNNMYFLLQHYWLAPGGSSCSTTGIDANYLSASFTYPAEMDAYILKTDESMTNVLATHNIGGISVAGDTPINGGEISVVSDKLIVMFNNESNGVLNLHLTPNGPNLGSTMNTIIMGLTSDLNYKYHTSYLTGYGNSDLVMQLDQKNDQLAFLAKAESPNNPTNFTHNFFINHYKANANVITGIVYKDYNQNATFDAGDYTINGSAVQITPNPYLVVTNPNGSYFAYVDTGSYFLNLMNYPSYFTQTPTTSSVFFGLPNMTITKNLRIIPVPGGHDVSVELIPMDQMVISDTAEHKIIVSNPGTFTENVTVTFNPISYSLPFSDFQISPSMTNAGTYFTTTIPNLAPGASVEFLIKYMVPTSFLPILGSTANSSVTVTTQNIDEVPYDNYAMVSNVIVGPYDPNVKFVNQSDLIYSDQLDSLKWFNYTIHFQNEGNFPATKVRIDDIIEDNLILNTLKIIDASHNIRTTISGKTVSFHYDNIMLPGVATDENGSKGYVHFKLQRKNGLAIGDSIQNQASIFFDFNPAIITNTTVNTIVLNDLSVGTYGLNSKIKAYPNPATDQIVITGFLPSLSQIELYDIHGHTLNRTAVNGKSDVKLDVNKLTPGLYFIRIGNETVRFLKQ